MKMNKKIVALAIIVCVVVASAVVYVAKSRQPSQSAQGGGSQFNSVNDQLNDLGNFLTFENQTFDFNLGDISGGWG
jgi:uncharacterized protein YpmB